MTRRLLAGLLLILVIFLVGGMASADYPPEGLCVDLKRLPIGPDQFCTPPIPPHN